MIFRDQEHYDKIHRRLTMIVWFGRVSYVGLIVGMQAATTHGHLKGMVEVSNLVRDTQRVVEKAIERQKDTHHE